ncbi:hypothetical protein LCGC14_0175280 [marine sediment metagenome]|uniref:Uncharacterized protein n=1 Tax=marine sediment metagenome TaxID=412755 RepID=A0A0F9UV92_9ZZZZ
MTLPNTKEEYEILFDEHKQKKLVAEALNISRPTLDSEIKKVGFDYETWKQKHMKNNQTTPGQTRTRSRKIKKSLPTMEIAMAMVKKRLEREMAFQIKEFGYENVNHRRIYNRLYGEIKRDRQTVEFAFRHLLDELKLEGY